MNIQPCPFCGDDKPVPSHSENGEWNYVTCWGCDATTGPHETAGKAVDAWNRRALPAELVEAWREYEPYGDEDIATSEWIPAVERLIEVVRQCVEKGGVI